MDGSEGLPLAISIVAFVGLILLVTLVPVMGRVKRGPDALAAELASRGETAVLGPEQAIYRGSTARGYSRVKGNAAVALTESRLVFHKAVGKPVEVPRASIESVRQDQVFAGSIVGGRTHVIVQVPDGEVGFFVADPDRWMAALTR